MKNRASLFSLAALLLAGASLVGCGGGDAEPPPPPVSNPPAAPDTTAPTLQIANNVSTPAATGPVTFTFVFSEDVGTSFDATDITVDGGSPSAFTRVGGTQATLLVTPTPGVPGTMTVSVAAGSFSDIAGNASTAAAYRRPGCRAMRT
jgi:Bacterial Ig-like domain